MSVGVELPARCARGFSCDAIAHQLPVARELRRSILGLQVQISSQGLLNVVWTRTPDSVTIGYLDFNIMTLSAEQSEFVSNKTKLFHTQPHSNRLKKPRTEK